MANKFATAPEVLTELQQLQLSQSILQHNRTLINRAANGEAPYTEEEQRQENIKSNFNSLELCRICSNAVNQINNAMEKGARYFTVRVDKGPMRLRSAIGTIITNEINRPLKRSRLYKCARESSRAQLVLHGPGPLVWKNQRKPVPSEAGIEDVLIPAGTLASMANLDRWAVYRELTWSELEDMALGKTADKGWNTEYVKAIMAMLYGQGYQPAYQGNRWMFPEKLAEDYKEGAISRVSSSLPKALCWDFFFMDQDTGKWNRRLCLDYASLVSSSDSPLKESSAVMKNRNFLYEKDDYAEDWSNIIHWYIGNCSNVAPYRYHSIRSIGYLLYGVCSIQNKLRMKLTDHMFQQLLTWFRNVSDDNREKLGLIDLQNFGVMPDGVSMVTANERHVADWNLIMMGLNQGRQLMAESASAFIPDMAGNPTDQKTMTATETLVRQNTSVTLTSAVLNQLSEQSTYEYREICRRFCLKGNPDPMAKAFREAIQREGVPLEMLDFEAWEIIPEQTVGGGNKAMELTVTKAMMEEVYPLVGPDAQRQILRRRTMALNDNPDEAMMLVPDAPNTGNDDVQYAQGAFAVLMLGVPFQMREGENPIVYCSTLLQMMQVTMQQVGAALQQPTGISLAAERLVGLANVEQAIQAGIQMIAQDKRQIEIAKGLGKALQQIDGAMQQMGKKLQAMEEEHAQQQGGPDPEVQAKIQERLIMAQNQAQLDAHKASQKSEQKAISWSEENARRNATTAAEIQRKAMLAHAEVAKVDLLTRADLIRQVNKPEEVGK